MSLLIKVLSILAAVLSLIAFALIACFLSGLYPLVPELLCYSAYGLAFQALLAATFSMHLGSLAHLSRSRGQVSLSAATLMSGAVVAAVVLLVTVFSIIRALRHAQLDSGCMRSMAPPLIRFFTLAYVGPILSGVLAIVTVAVSCRALRQDAF
jgi:hypothetical protein